MQIDVRHYATISDLFLLFESEAGHNSNLHFKCSRTVIEIIKGFAEIRRAGQTVGLPKFKLRQIFGALLSLDCDSVGVKLQLIQGAAQLADCNLCNKI